ncbi:transposase [Glutamicibacter sp. AGC13]
MAKLSEQNAPGFQDQPGLGSVATGIILSSYSHQGRFLSEASFVPLADAGPLQASSGNVTRHRLNRHGDRKISSQVRPSQAKQPAWPQFPLPMHRLVDPSLFR